MGRDMMARAHLPRQPAAAPGEPGRPLGRPGAWSFPRGRERWTGAPTADAPPTNERDLPSQPGRDRYGSPPPAAEQRAARAALSAARDRDAWLAATAQEAFK